MDGKRNPMECLLDKNDALKGENRVIYEEKKHQGEKLNRIMNKNTIPSNKNY